MILLLGAASAASQEPRRAEIRELGWLAGCWSGEESGTETMECWTAPRAGLMLGWNRTVRGEARSSFEFLRIAATADGVVYFASPGGREATPFRLVEVSEGSALFENPEHDFPQRIRYELAADGALRVRVEATVDGASRHLEWTWRATDFPGRDPSGGEGSAQGPTSDASAALTSRAYLSTPLKSARAILSR